MTQVAERERILFRRMIDLTPKGVVRNAVPYVSFGAGDASEPRHMYEMPLVEYAESMKELEVDSAC